MSQYLSSRSTTILSNIIFIMICLMAYGDIFKVAKKDM